MKSKTVTLFTNAKINDVDRLQLNGRAVHFHSKAVPRMLRHGIKANVSCRHRNWQTVVVNCVFATAPDKNLSKKRRKRKGVCC